MSNKFAQALKPKVADVQPIATPDDAKDQDEGKRTPPSRKSTKLIGGHFDPVVSKQLRQVALTEDTTVQALVGEALDMLFQSRQMPTIARRPKD